MLALAIQHEYDHLKGKLFVDNISYIKRMGLSFKLNRIATIAQTMKDEVTYLN
jgi:peptide deformylase